VLGSEDRLFLDEIRQQPAALRALLAAGEQLAFRPRWGVPLQAHLEILELDPSDVHRDAPKWKGRGSIPIHRSDVAKLRAGRP
jgi:hypothetical protein